MSDIIKENDDRIFEILKSIHENVEDLKVPVSSLIERVHGLGIIGDENTDKIQAACVKVIDSIRSSAGCFSGAVTDAKEVSKIFKKMFGY